MMKRRASSEARNSAAVRRTRACDQQAAAQWRVWCIVPEGLSVIISGGDRGVIWG